MNKRKFALWTLAIVAIIGAVGYWFLNVPETPSPHGSVSKARFSPGPYHVVSETFEAVDESRPTPAYKDFPGLPRRVFAGELWRPEGREQPGPLLVYSHGFMSFRQEGLYLHRFLASHGYTVVAVDYPLTGFYAPEGPLMTDVINQPGDISFLIDLVLKRNSDSADSLYQTIDPEKIAVAGVSLGGLTATLATFHRKLRDPRIAASISVAGPTSIFTSEFFAGRETPFLMIYGGGDAIVAYEDNAVPAKEMYPSAVLVKLVDASHAGFAQPSSTLMRFISNPDGIGCRVVTEELSVEVAEQNRDFMAQLGDEGDGIDLDKQIEFCDAELIPVAMKASRQHMFTTLAAHAFLESLFAESPGERGESRTYLLQTLAEENAAEVEVIPPGSP